MCDRHIHVAQLGLSGASSKQPEFTHPWKLVENPMMESAFPSASHTTGVSYGNSRGGLPSLGVPINSKPSSFPRHLYDTRLLVA